MEAEQSSDRECTQRSTIDTRSVSPSPWCQQSGQVSALHLDYSPDSDPTRSEIYILIGCVISSRLSFTAQKGEEEEEEDVIIVTITVVRGDRAQTPETGNKMK
ncbi:hypothetical protein AAFF_G00013840 [Aldrovandia affinis]|uniref:Uncharacterized protein n=1 Tax=Aldrovandia affinis TaxID=143900 RepID=A0AAD7S6E4_9TELE|nr:hypothetical protein AAFF_G00013840 [Aldrovandia affinis]